nr:hypothetical protein [Rhodococcus zopfii]
MPEIPLHGRDVLLEQVEILAVVVAHLAEQTGHQEQPGQQLRTRFARQCRAEADGLGHDVAAVGRCHGEHHVLPDAALLAGELEHFVRHVPGDGPSDDVEVAFLAVLAVPAVPRGHRKVGREHGLRRVLLIARSLDRVRECVPDEIRVAFQPPPVGEGCVAHDDLPMMWPGSDSIAVVQGDGCFCTG